MAQKRNQIFSICNFLQAIVIYSLIFCYILLLLIGQQEDVVGAKEVVHSTIEQSVSYDLLERLSRWLIEIQLNSVDIETRNIKKNNNISKLERAIETFEKLKIANLKAIFDKIFLPLKLEKTISVGDISQTTALFYSIITEDKTAIIINLPNGKKKLAWINISNQSLRQEINSFRLGLESRSNIIYDTKQAQKLYNWIIRPFANDLESLHIKTLVFIHDEILQGVPMAALHDGEKFLVQKYATATLPCLRLTNTQKVNHKNIQALVVGLTKDARVDGRIYKALTYIQQEIDGIAAQVPGSKILLNENFTYQSLHAELRQKYYPIIHIATHGEYGIPPQETFLVTGNNQKLTMTDLSALIRSASYGTNSVELLALTACETATGDKRTIFGLAGVAVKAGVKSALASLWSVNDAATQTLTTQFYKEWAKTGMSKAEALQRAQQETIATDKVYAHPYYWAPFILIGNWL